MINKDFLKFDENDLEEFTKDLNNYKLKLTQLYTQSPLTISQYQHFNDANSKISDAIILKYSYHFYANADDKIVSVFQDLIKENQKLSFELFQSQEFYEFAQKLIVEDEEDAVVKKRLLKAFENAGLNLPKEKQQEVNVLKEKLSELTIRYNKNISDHKAKIQLDLDPELKEVLSQEDMKFFNGNDFIKFNQHIFSDIQETATTEMLRKKTSLLSKSIASAGSEYDNSPLIKEILSIKHALANILGKKDYTEVQLEDRMAKNSQEVISFLYDVSEKVYPLAKQETQEFEDFVRREYGVHDIAFHDRNFYGNKYDQQKFNYIKDEEREFFSLKSAQQVVFEMIENLFNITFKKLDDVELPYEDTECYKVYNNGIYKGIMIADFYLRERKNQGAWVSSLQSPSILEDGVVTINANFDKEKVGLSLDDIVTLFHEYGHLVHTFSTATKYSSLSGTSGMARDAVEIPSQMFEQYAKSPSVLKYISRKTGKEIPDTMVEKLIAMNKDGIGNFYSSQISFALYDMFIHSQPDSDPHELFNEISMQVIPKKIDPESNFPNRFSHIFSGGYSAGYYGYMWADVYAIDAFMFVNANEQENKLAFKQFLSKGSSQDAEEIYTQFRGQKADVGNFLDYYGINKKISRKVKI